MGSEGSDSRHGPSPEPEGPVGIDRQIERLERRRSSKEGRRSAGSLRGQRVRDSAERLIARTTSGVIYAVVFTACLLGGRVSTTLLVSAMAWLCCSEFFRISRMGGRMPNETTGLAAAALFPVAAYLRGLEGLILLTFVLLFACGIWYVTTPRASIGDVCVTAFGPIYTSLSFSSVVLMRSHGTGVLGGLLCFCVILSLWANDSAAYLVGSRLGRHKMAPRISPKKSWEGFVGGLVACVAVWVVLGLLGVHGLGPVASALAGALVGLAGVIGDLFESRIKRGVGVKDSGNLMPGHGGLLDRSDSLLFGCVVAYFVLLFGGAL